MRRFKNIVTIIVLNLHDIVPDIVPDIVYDNTFEDIKLMMLLVQNCVCVVASYPFRIEQLKDFDPIGDLDVKGGVIFGMRGPFFSLLAPYVPLVILVILPHTRMFPWSSSTPLSPSA
jgi:hypothetical protein